MSSSSSTSGSSSAAPAATPSMKYRNLGNSGLKVSELCLGTMTFSLTGSAIMGLPSATEKESMAILDAFVAAGGNFIDTADAYAESEALIGKWLSSKPNPKEFRRSLIIATKYSFPTGPNPNDKGASRKHILEAVERSLAALQTDYIDLYQQHIWSSETPLIETLFTLNELVKSGKVLYVGVSNFTAAQIAKAKEMIRTHHLHPALVSLQPQYSLLCRSIEWDIVPTCVEEGLGILPWSPLAGGWLSGKYKRNAEKPVEGGRVEWAEKMKFKETDWTTKKEGQTYDIIETCILISRELKTTVAAVALRWVMQRKGVSSVIIGAKNLEQLNANLEATKIELSEQQMERLNKVSDTPLPYPFSMIQSVGNR